MVLCFVALPALAQDQNGQLPPAIVFPRDAAVTSTLVKAFNTGGSGDSGSSGDAQWLKVEFQYSVNPPPMVNPAPGSNPQNGDFLNEVEFKVWIEGRDMNDPQGQPGKGLAITLTGAVTYINVAKSRTAYGVFYVHPSTLARYNDPRDGVEGYERKYDVHVEASVDGKVVAAADKGREDKADWYMPPALKPMAGLVYRQDQCPFLNADPDRYPAIKLPDSEAK